MPTSSLRNPALAAMEIATLARLFPGPVRPGNLQGCGVQDWMAQVGARAASPMGLLREWTTAVRSLLSGDTVTVAGTYVNLDRVALDWPPTTAVPRSRLGARGPRTLAPGGRSWPMASSWTPATRAGHRPPGHRPGDATARPHDIVVYLPCGAGPGSAERIPEAELRRPRRRERRTGPRPGRPRIVVKHHPRVRPGGSDCGGPPAEPATTWTWRKTIRLAGAARTVYARRRRGLTADGGGRSRPAEAGRHHRADRLQAASSPVARGCG